MKNVKVSQVQKKPNIWYTVFKYVYIRHVPNTHIYITDKTDYDIETLKKECQNLCELLIPSCQVELIVILGEGIPRFGKMC